MSPGYENGKGPDISAADVKPFSVVEKRAFVSDKTCVRFRENARLFLEKPEFVSDETRVRFLFLAGHLVNQCTTLHDIGV